MTVRRAPYQPDQEISDYTARDLVTSSAITGDFTTDSLKYGFGPTSLSAEDDYDATYGKAQAKIRRRLKNELMGEATMGTEAGEWSARKSQELKRRYEAACERAGLKPYKGSKTTKQKDLSDWSDQDWRTSSGGKSSVTGEPYFPAKAVEALKERDLYAKAKRQKAAATRAGKQRATYSDDIQAVVARYRAEYVEPPMDLEEEAQARLEAIRQLQWGLRVIERMLREGNIDDAREFARITVHAMDQEDEAARDLGLDPDRFSAEGDPSFAPDPDLPLTEQARDEYTFMLPDGSTLWIHNQDWAVRMADMKPIWDLERLADYGGTPTTVTYMSLGAVDPADYTDFIPEWRPGMSFPPEDMVNQWIDPTRLGEAHNEFTKQYENVFWPGLSLREILGRHDGGNPVFDAESDPVSRIAAGTNDALADFANAHDTDDGFYLIGGLIGGLAIAVAGNILADRVQEWWKGRSSS